MLTKKLISFLLCMVLTVGLFAGCSSQNSNESHVSKSDKDKSSVSTVISSTDDANNPGIGVDTDKNEKDTSLDTEIKTDAVLIDLSDIKLGNQMYASYASYKRPVLMSKTDTGLYDSSIVANVPAYSVADGWSNVINSYIIEWMSEDFQNKLKNNLFAVSGCSGNEFFEVYENNRYSQMPSFITVDSLMHTYHLYFAHLLKNTEKAYLTRLIKKISISMFEESVRQAESFSGTDWEEAALANCAYFAVACNLIGENVSVPTSLKDKVKSELSLIESGEGITVSPILDYYEDYSQYTVRGYYAGDESLSQYFKTMMWYGRMNLSSESEASTRSAVLMSLALDEKCKDEWEAVYAVTSFFAGASDDHIYSDYMPLIRECFGNDVKAETISCDKAAFDKCFKMIKELPAPKIQSIPVEKSEDNVIAGLRFMGQRFSIDAEVMQNLVYRAVNENSLGEARMLPSALDFPAALGSDIALDITLKNGADKFPDYSKNMTELRNVISNISENTWETSLYSNWINVLRPLLDEKGSGYPSFMLSKEWGKHNIETFVGSYTELKHDTVLYTKQMMAEMGGGPDDDIDDRGYVEPEPLLYSRFANLSEATLNGLSKCKLISEADKENLQRLTDISKRLLIISQKELKNEVLSDEEYDFIREYGGNLEHFWYDVVSADYPDELYTTTDEHPACLVTDIATDPNGYVLELGLKNPANIYVVVSVDGKLRIARGSVYDFYEFSWPLSDRLTDEKWAYISGSKPYFDDNYDYIDLTDPSIVKPSWTYSFWAGVYSGSMY